MTNGFAMPGDLVLGTRLNKRVPAGDQVRQRREVEVILARLANQPGVVLADEVGMGKTFVALAVAYSVAMRSRTGPVIVMVPSNLVDKWEQDLATFCELYVERSKAGTTGRRFGEAADRPECASIWRRPPQHRAAEAARRFAARAMPPDFPGARAP